MVISWSDKYNKKITAVYWSDGLNCKDIEEYGKTCDYIQIWYPQNLADDIYKKYRELITYIEIEAKWKGEACSSQMDLSLSCEKILQQFSKSKRYEVKRAKERDRLIIEFLSKLNEKELTEFEIFYNRFARQTNELDNLDIRKVSAMNKSNQFVLARIMDEKGEILTIHGYVVDREEKIAALFSSSSYFRENKEKSALIGRANGLLHYESMLYFKSCGFSVYDFGGVYCGNENQHRMSVAAFKRSLGGEIKTFQNGFIIPIREAMLINQNLSELTDKIRNADIALWGYSSFGKYIERVLEEHFAKKCKYIIDNKLCKEDTKCVNEQILSKLDMENVFILVSTSIENYHKISAQNNVKEFVENGRILCLRGGLYVDKI